MFLLMALMWYYFWGSSRDYFIENSLLKSKSASGKPLLEYAYDRSRNLSCLTDSAGSTLHYTYDAMDRLKQVSEGQGDLLALVKNNLMMMNFLKMHG